MLTIKRTSQFKKDFKRITKQGVDVQPDWLLIYLVDKGNLILTLTRTGSHSDLFN